MDESPTRASAPSHGRRTILLVLAAAAVAAAVFLAGRALSSGGDSPSHPNTGGGGAIETEGPTFRNASLSIGYIGSKACVECHQSEGASYHATHHARSFSVIDPSKEELPARFHHPASALDYWMREVDGKLQIQESVTLTSGKLEVLNDVPLTYAIGSGARARSYATELGGFLVQAPATHYPAPRGWGVSEGYDVSVHPGFTLPVAEHCLSCHVGRFEMQERSLNRVEILEGAISCESCHGPGALHAEFRRGPDAPPKGSPDADDTIVSIRRMSRTQQMDVCAQCHMDPYMTVAHPGKSLRDWRPGMPWGTNQTTYRPSATSIAPHEFAGHVDQLRSSRCYQESRTLSCITCHGAHGDESSESVKNFANTQCITCHQACDRPASGGEASVLPASDDCTSCHMPPREVSQMHLARTHHDIRVHKAKAEWRPRAGKVTLLPLRGTDILGRGVRERNLGLAYILAAARTPDPRIKKAYVAEARLALEESVLLGLEEAEQQYALGMLIFRQRIGPKGAAKLQRAIELDEEGASTLSPAARVSALSELVDHLLGQRDFKMAREYLERLTKLRRHAEDWLRLANLNRVEEDTEGAEQAVRKALEILPNQPGVLFQAGDFLGGLGFSADKRRCDDIGGFLHRRHSAPPPK